MRFKSTVAELSTFVKLVASLNLLGQVTWMKLDDDFVRFTVIPEQGSQVWAVLPVHAIFDQDYTIQSASEGNMINLEVPLAPLHRALRTAHGCLAASLRLTKKDNAPLLCLTIHTAIQVTGAGGTAGSLGTNEQPASLPQPPSSAAPPHPAQDAGTGRGSMVQKETLVSQDIPIRVLPASSVEGIHEPRCKEPEVHIMLPPLSQIKTISERFTRIALAAKKPSASAASMLTDIGPKLVVKANMHGELSVGIRTDTLAVESRWTGLLNPALDPNVVEGGEDGVRQHPSELWRRKRGDESWAAVRVDGKDWSRVLGVGRCGGRVVACFCDDHALILYVYLPREDGDDNESVLTYYISSYAE